MATEHKNETQSLENADITENMLRTITMLEKALERKVRQCYFNPAQYPEQYHNIMAALRMLRLWINIYQAFSHAASFHGLMAISLDTLGKLATDFIALCRPVNGRKQSKQAKKQEQGLATSISKMLNHIQDYMEQLESNPTTDVAVEIETALVTAFAKHCRQEHKKWIKIDYVRKQRLASNLPRRKINFQSVARLFLF
jgi:hypothetical protein